MVADVGHQNCMSYQFDDTCRRAGTYIYSSFCCDWASVSNFKDGRLHVSGLQSCSKRSGVKWCKIRTESYESELSTRIYMYTYIYYIHTYIHIGCEVEEDKKTRHATIAEIYRSNSTVIFRRKFSFRPYMQANHRTSGLYLYEYDELIFQNACQPFPSRSDYSWPIT